MNYMSLVWCSIWYKRGRTSLTVLSTASAFLLLGILQGAGYTLEHPSPGLGADTLVVINRVSYGMPLPYAYLESIRSQPQVQLAVTGDHISGYYRDPAKPVRANAVESAEDYFSLMHDQVGISAAQLKSLQETRSGAVVGPSIARRYGWKVGDLVTLHANGNYVQSNGSLDWTFTIVGIEQIRDPREINQFGDDFRFQYTFLDETRALNKGNVSMFLVKPKPSADAGQLAKAIDARFANSPFETRTVPLKELVLILVRQLGSVGAIVRAISAAVLFTLVLMIGNVMMHNFHEKIPQFAVLKSLGFTDRRVGTLVAAESATTCLLGASFGVGGACLLLPMMRKVIDVSGLNYAPVALLPGVAAALVLVIGVGLIPAWRAQRLQIVDALVNRH